VGYKLESTAPFNVTEIQKPLITEGITSSVTVGLARDTRNRVNMFETTSGASTYASAELAGYSLFGGDNEFLKLEFEHRYFFPFYKIKKDIPLISSSVFQYRGMVGGVFSTEEGKAVPLFERYYPGGLNSIRGFQTASLGPSVFVASSNDPTTLTNKEFHVGGNKQFLMNFEYLIPIFDDDRPSWQVTDPEQAISRNGVKALVFFDLGNAFNNDESIRLDDLRYSAGFGIRWFTPIGLPLRFEWGFPINRREDEKTYVFDFSIGTSFY